MEAPVITPKRIWRSTELWAATGVATAGGRELHLIEVQPAGGRRMPWDDFVRGRSSIVGASILG